MHVMHHPVDKYTTVLYKLLRATETECRLRSISWGDHRKNIPCKLKSGRYSGISKFHFALVWLEFSEFSTDVTVVLRIEDADLYRLGSWRSREGII